MGQRRLLQDLFRDLDTILMPARQRHSKGPRRVGTVPGPLPTASAAGLGPDQGGGPRRCRLKVVKLLPGVRWTLGVAEGSYEGEDEDEGAEVPSSIRRRLIFTTPQEEPRLARAWRDLESKAEAILPKTVQARALALLRRLMDGGYISWRPDTLELIVDGIEHKGTNLVDLAGHVVWQRRTEPLMHGSPGLPWGFADFRGRAQVC